jgi:hydroxypyruvate isomerase
MPIKHAIAWWCYAEKAGPDRLIREAARLGYDAIHNAPRERWDAIHAAGLQLSCSVAHAWTGGMNDRTQHNRIEEEVHQNLALAKQYSIPGLACLVGKRYGESDERGIDVTAECLLRVSKAAEQAGVDLLVELMNSKIDQPGFQGDSTIWGVELMKRVDSPRVKLLYDIYHMQIMEGDLIRTIRTYHQYIGHYHTGGVPGRHEIDDTQEINYPAVIAAIRETGFDGYVTQEFLPTGDPIEALRQALAICGGKS